ncbi:hypothetical protein Btru_062925 [Bulinus truncatus]|nr:hypothetical protein Btru_062925 [Bulinus truncatus]
MTVGESGVTPDDCGGEKAARCWWYIQFRYSLAAVLPLPSSKSVGDATGCTDATISSSNNLLSSMREGMHSRCMLIVLLAVTGNRVTTSADDGCVQRVDALCPDLEWNCSSVHTPEAPLCLTKNCPASDVDYILTKICDFIHTYRVIEETVNSFPQSCLDHMEGENCIPLLSDIPQRSIKAVDKHLKSLCHEIQNSGKTCILTYNSSSSSPCSRQDYDALMHATCVESATSAARPAATSPLNWKLLLLLLLCLTVFTCSTLK